MYKGIQNRSIGSIVCQSLNVTHKKPLKSSTSAGLLNKSY